MTSGTTRRVPSTCSCGTVVVTGLNKLEIPTVTVSGSIMTLFRKTIKGSLFGDCNPTTDIPKILGLYQAGDLRLDEIITRTYTLDEVNEGYEDLLAGKNVRGVIVHEHRPGGQRHGPIGGESSGPSRREACGARQPARWAGRA